MPSRLIIAIATLALLVAAAGVTLVAAGDGGDALQSVEERGDVAPAERPPAPVVGGGAPGADGAPGPTAGARREVERFRRQVKQACEDAGAVVRVSASASSRDRRKEMSREITYLEGLHEKLAKVKAPDGDLKEELSAYRRRLKAQIVLDKRIAKAGDSYSVDVGMRQNQENRDARNDIVERAPLPRCLGAPEPR